MGPRQHDRLGLRRLREPRCVASLRPLNLRPENQLTAVPRPGEDFNVNAPSIAAARWRMFASPCAAASATGTNPVPSSRIVTSGSVPRSAITTQARRA